MPIIPDKRLLAPLSTQTTYPTRKVADIEVVDLPGTYFVQGSPLYGQEDNSPRWVAAPAVSMATRPVTNALFAPLMGRELKSGTEDHPVVGVSTDDAEEFILRFNQEYGTEFGLPTAVEWEYAARGQLVDVRALMAHHGIAVQDFADWFIKRDRVENVFAGRLGTTIYNGNDLHGDIFQNLLRTAVPLYGYSVYGQLDGFDKRKIWYNQETTAAVSDAAAQERANSYGLIDMLGNVQYWMGERLVDARGEYRISRGGAFNEVHHNCLNVPSTLKNMRFSADERLSDISFRLALARSVGP